MKFFIAGSHQLVPAAKHILYKNLLKLDSPVQRGCVGSVLDKLSIEDKESSSHVKQLTAQNDNETTPDARGCSKKATKTALVNAVAHDPSLASLDVSEYQNVNNVGCRVVRVVDTYILANSKKPHLIILHQPMVDAYGKALPGGSRRCPLPACKKEYIVGVTKIGPVVVVGPVSSTNSSKSLIFQNPLHSCKICFFSLLPNVEKIVKEKNHRPYLFQTCFI